MRRRVTVLFVILATLGNAATVFAGAGFDACSAEEQRLRALERANCSGLRYVFDPNSCFATRKQLLPYDSGQCRAIAAGEGETVSPAPTVEPPPKRAVPEAAGGKDAGEGPPSAAAVPEPVPVMTVARLQQEVADLRRELEALKATVMQLQGEVQRSRSR